jgi:hypothetical protein
MMENVGKIALFLAAKQRMTDGGYAVRGGLIEPRIIRQHVDGPYLRALDGSIQWLTAWERLMTKLGIWDAWEIEWRHFPLPIEEQQS